MTRKISWTYMGTSGILYIDLVKNGDLVSYIPPTANLSTPPTPIALQNGNGSYDWAIPAGLELGTDYQIYIQAIAPPKVSDSMGDFFSITGPQNTLAIAGATGTSGGSVSGGIGLNCRIAANGAVAGTCSEYNDPNASIVLTAAPDTGATVTWSGCTSTTGNTCNVTLSSNKTVSASFNTASYTITASPGANGTISCVPTSVVSNGSSICTITPNSGYYVSDVMVGPSGGTLSSVGRLTSYTFSGVITDMTISAAFQISTVKRIGATTEYFSNLIDAYAAAANNDIIEALAMTFEGNLNLNRPVQVQLSGGYNSGFSSQASFSEIHGNMTISAGGVYLDRLILK
jgi:hypothetical protein